MKQLVPIQAIALITSGLLCACTAGSTTAGRSTRSSPQATVPATSAPCRAGWSVASGAVPAGDYRDWLVAIAGSASDDVWAVGDRLPDPRHVLPLFEHWNGRGWTYSAGASVGGRQAWLTSVAAPASDDAWAVGYFASVGQKQPTPLIEHWNGRSWSLQPTVALIRVKGALPQTTLVSVAALAPDDVWVLGHGVRGSGPFDVFLHWDGTSWKLFPGPHFVSPLLGSSWMQVLGADYRQHVWASGGWVRGHGEAGTPAGGIAERWNGRRWAADRRTAWRYPLTMVAPVAPDDVWAITGGSFTIAGAGYGVSPIEVLHWNGSTWRVALSLGGTGSVDTGGLVALSADDAYVIGQDTRTDHPFIKHWDGTRWRSVRRGPPDRIQPPGSIGVTLTSEGSIAALEQAGATDRANYLWLRCAAFVHR